MTKKLNKQAGYGSALPLSKKLPPSVDVEEVLEHISSPFRWEVLEVPPAKPASATPKNPNPKR